MSDIVYSDTGAVGAQYQLRVDGTNLELLRDGVVIDAQPLASVNSVTINGGSGDDTLLIDQVIALPGGVNFNGGLPVGAPGDAIIVTAGADSVIYNYTNATDGRIVFTRGGATAVYNFTGIDPLTDGAITTSRTFGLPGGTDTQLEDDGTPGNNMSELRDTLGGYESTIFVNPTASLSVLGQPSDSVTVNLVDSLGAADLTVNSGTVLVGVNGVNTTGNVNLTSTASNLDVGGPVSSGGTVTLSSALQIFDSTPGEQADITANSLALIAAGGIGAVNDINTRVSTLAFSNTSGDVRVSNVGALTIGSVGSLTSSTNSGGATAISAGSPLTVATDMSSAGTLALTAFETVPPVASFDTLTINSGVTASSTGGDVVLLAGDDVVVNGTVQGGNIDLQSGFGDNDNEGSITLAGTISSSGTVALNVVTSNSAVGSGGVTQSAGSIAAAGLLLLNFPSGFNAFTLTQANHVGTIAATTHAPITFNDAQALSVGSVNSPDEGITSFGILTTDNNITLTASSLSIDQNITVGSAIVDLSTTGGDLTEGPALSIHAAELRSTSGVAGSVSLTGPNQLTSVGPFTATGDFTLVDIGLPLTVDAVTAATITINAGALTIDGPLGSPGTVTLNSGFTVINHPLSNIGALVSNAVTTFIPGGAVTTSGAQSYHSAVTLTVPTTLTSTAGGSISVDGVVNDGAGLSVSTDGAALFSSAISGLGGFSQDGTGTTSLIGLNDYFGLTQVNAGTLLVEGAIATSSTLVNGGTLAGHGITGTVNVMSGGTLTAGLVGGAGMLTTANLTLAAGAHLAIEVGGVLPGSGYDQVHVNGTVDLGGATLDTSLIGGFAPPIGSSFTIIDNDGADAVTGTFAGLAEGAIFSDGGARYAISYHGGDGNDVVLTLADLAPVNTVPATQEIEANTATAIAGLAISDPDSGLGIETTTLSVTHGTLTVAAVGGTVTGSGTSSVTLTGTVAQIDATLSAPGNVVYQGAHDFFGTDTLTMVTNDLGNTGPGGPLTDTDQVTLHLNTHLIGTPADDTFTALPGNERIDALGGLNDTVSFDFRLVDAHISFVGNEVIVDGPSGSHTLLTGVEVYKFTDGTVNDNDGDPLVDDLFYYSQNHDVWLAGADADAHYHTIGWKEGRDPDAFFSTSNYLSLYPAVKAAGVDPLFEFDHAGWYAGHAPSIAFDDAAYQAANGDVAAAQVDPLAQFLKFGEGELRVPFAFDHLVAPNGFDYVYYLQHNPDVAAAHVDPLQHYETVGWHEGRNPNAYFDTAGYLAHYADAAASGIDPLDHYDQVGWKEGHDPSVNFDTSHYLAAYADVAAAHIDPLLHFLQNGLAEGRSSFADGVWAS